VEKGDDLLAELLNYFRKKQQEIESEKIYNTQCPFCSMQCKVQLIEQSIVSRKKYRAVGYDNPTSEGRLCIKGINAHQHALHPHRIQTPLLKVDGEFIPVTWQQALKTIRNKIDGLQTNYGHNSISVYGSGSLTNESAYLLGKFARVALKTKYIDYNGRFCMSAAATAANQAFGMDRGLTNSLSDIPNTNCIILVGTNIAECQPTIMPYFKRAKKNGAYIIVIDPRDTATSKLADLHLKVKPGRDASLSNGIAKILLEDGYCDEEFIKNRTSGFAELKKYLLSLNISEISAETGIDVKQIFEAATMFGTAYSGMIFTARGVEQQTDGYMAVRNFLNILLMTGKIGKPYSGYGAITGQGNGQGGREHGQKADQLPGYRSIEDPTHRSYIADVWGIKEEDLPTKGVSAYEMMGKIDEGEIRSMFVVGSNPVVSNPNANYVKRVLSKLDFLVVFDMFKSETAELADLILPTSNYLENEGTMTNLEGRVTLREASKPLRGDIKHDWQTLGEIATVLGKGEYFSYFSPEDIFNELRVASKGGIADYYGITYERLRSEGGILWPCPDTTHKGTERLFETSFATTDQKAQFIAVPNNPKVKKEDVDSTYPLYLTTGRIMSHYLTGVQTRNTDALATRERESYIEIHPSVAKTYGIEDQSLVEVESRRGSIVVKSKITEKIRPDTVFVPFHWDKEQNVNRLTDEELDPTCRMPGFKVCAVNIKPVKL